MGNTNSWRLPFSINRKLPQPNHGHQYNPSFWDRFPHLRHPRNDFRSLSRSHSTSRIGTFCNTIQTLPLDTQAEDRALHSSILNHARHTTTQSSLCSLNYLHNFALLSTISNSIRNSAIPLPNLHLYANIPIPLSTRLLIHSPSRILTHNLYPLLNNSLHAHKTTSSSFLFIQQHHSRSRYPKLDPCCRWFT